MKVEEGVLLVSGARTATTNSPEFVNDDEAGGIVVTLNITAIVTGGITPTLQLHDPVTDLWATVLAGTLRATAALFTQVFYAPTAPLPRRWRVSFVHSDATSWTYSAGYSTLA